MVIQQVPHDGRLAVKREAEMPDAAFLLLLFEVVQHARLFVDVLELFEITE